MVSFSLVASAGAATTYVLDTHGTGALYILSLAKVSYHLIVYGTTFFVNGVFVTRGFTTSLLILGVCQAVCCLAPIPMYVYGKRVRSFVSNSRPFCALSPCYCRVIIDAERTPHRLLAIPASQRVPPGRSAWRQNPTVPSQGLRPCRSPIPS